MPGKNQKENEMRVSAILLFFLLVFPLSAGCAITEKYGPYYGRVVDSETMEPIEGAAVLAVFYTEEYGPAGAITRYADSIETVTDKDGAFKIPAYRVTVFRPLQGWDKHGHFTIFKPGYGCYPHHKDVTPMFVPNGTLPEGQRVTVKLPILKTREERLDNTDCFPVSIPNEKMKTFIQINNIERVRLGLQPTHVQEDKK